MKPEQKQHPTMREYATPIYKTWDKEGRTPPKGYKSWMEYLEKMAKK